MMTSLLFNPKVFYLLWMFSLFPHLLLCSLGLKFDLFSHYANQSPSQRVDVSLLGRWWKYDSYPEAQRLYHLIARFVLSLWGSVFEHAENKEPGFYTDLDVPFITAQIKSADSAENYSSSKRLWALQWSSDWTTITAVRCGWFLFISQVKTIS